MWEKTAGGKHERKSPLGRTRRRWENDIKIEFKLEGMAWNGVGEDGVEWFGLPHGRDKLQVLVNTVVTLPVPKAAGNFLTS
jgi:hypothetical protein